MLARVKLKDVASRALVNGGTLNRIGIMKDERELEELQLYI